MLILQVLLLYINVEDINAGNKNTTVALKVFDDGTFIHLYTCTLFVFTYYKSSMPIY